RFYNDPLLGYLPVFIHSRLNVFNILFADLVSVGKDISKVISEFVDFIGAKAGFILCLKDMHHVIVAQILKPNTIYTSVTIAFDNDIIKHFLKGLTQYRRNGKYLKG